MNKKTNALPTVSEEDLKRVMGGVGGNYGSWGPYDIARPKTPRLALDVPDSWKIHNEGD
jgi:hypothetical protein